MWMMQIVAWACAAIDLAIVVGLLVRHRASHAYALPFLLIALAAPTAVLAAYPTCNTWDFWIAREFVHLALLLLLGLETADRVFTAAPARRAAQRWTGFVFLSIVVVAASSGRELLIMGTLPALSGAVAWLYTGLAVVVLRYGVRIERLQDVILSGFPPYLMIHAATWSQAAEGTRIVQVVNPLVQLVLLVALLHAAWQRPQPKDAAWFLRILAQRRARTRPPGITHAEAATLAL